MKLGVLSSSIIAVAFTAQIAHAATTYEIIEIEPSDDYRQHYGTAISDNGTVLGLASDRFNFSFYSEEYLQTLSYGGLTCDVSESELATQNFDAYSSICIRSALFDSFSTIPTYQKLSNSKAFKSVNNQAELMPLLDDEIDSELGDYTYSNLEQMLAINSSGVAVGVGSAPYLPDELEGVRYWQQEYTSRAIVDVNGVVSVIEPEFDLYGGESSAADISDTGFVVGTTSVALADQTQANIDESCNEESLLINICVRSINQTVNVYKYSPVIWQIDAFGRLVSTQLFDTGNMLAVNNQGIAVGYGQASLSTTSTITVPLIFSDEGINSFIDVDDYISGYATDINNSEVIVGTVQSFINNDTHDEFFVYDLDTRNFETPSTFYEGSESSANAINDNGIVVGEAEYEVTTSNTRRKHGFIYDSSTKQFFDIHNLVSCNTEYEIVSLNDINNSDQIVATALKSMNKRDALGNISLNSDGSADLEQVSVTLLLNPIDGEPEDCIDDEDDKYERLGASNSFGFIVLLIGFALHRRRST